MSTVTKTTDDTDLLIDVPFYLGILCIVLAVIVVTSLVAIDLWLWAQTAKAFHD